MKLLVLAGNHAITTSLEKLYQLSSQERVKKTMK